MTAEQTLDLFKALISGLEDYTVDERGDVGSWVRIACIQGITSFSTTMFRYASTIPEFSKHFPSELYHAAIAGILKQGVERLDNVRQQAGERLVLLLKTALPVVPDASTWQIHGAELLKELFLG